MTLIIIGRFKAVCITVTSVEVDYTCQDLIYMMNGNEYIMSLESNYMNDREMDEEMGNIKTVIVNNTTIYDADVDSDISSDAD